MFIELSTKFPHIIDLIIYYSHGNEIESLMKIKNIELLNLLTKHELIKIFICVLNDCYKKVKNNYREFKNIDEIYQTTKLCINVIEKNNLMLQYVKEQTEEMCLFALKDDSYVFKYVKEQTPNICLAAVRQDCNVLEIKDGYGSSTFALQYVKKQTLEICMAAVEHDKNITIC